MENPITEYSLDVVSIRLVKENTLYSGTMIKTPNDAVKLVGEFLADMDREVFMIVNLSTKGKPINCNICTVGTLNASLVHPREVFKSAILSNAHSVIIVHNHPSGDTTPSKEDLAVTKQLMNAGKLLDIPLVDSIIIGNHPDRFLSMLEEGYIVDGKVTEFPNKFKEQPNTYNAKRISIRELIRETREKRLEESVPVIQKSEGLRM